MKLTGALANPLCNVLTTFRRLTPTLWTLAKTFWPLPVALAAVMAEGTELPSPPVKMAVFRPSL